MAEQSSTVATFRALVMLVCLILIPVAAFWGSSFPAVVKAVQSGRWPTLADFRGPAGPANTQAAEAPRFVPTPNRSPVATDPKMSGFPGPVSAFNPAMQGEAARSPVLPASYNAPIGNSPSNIDDRSTSFPQNNDPSSAANRGLLPVRPGTGDLLPVDHAAVANHVDTLANGPASSASSLPDGQLKFLLNRLQQLGATYFLLEPYGDEKREFRFYCRMAIGGNPRVTKPFWCFDSDPLKAMAQVLKQVEDWHSGGG